MNTSDSDTLIDLKYEKSDSSKDDPARKELLWERREEQLLLGWCKKLKFNSLAHGVKAKRTKHYYNMVSLPAILIPVVASSLSTVLQPYPLAMSGAMLVTSVFTGINGFFNLGAKTQLHFEFEYAYNKLANEIDKELCKPKRHRTACDLYMQIVLSEMDRLDASAPAL
jgi:uncharacterized protein YueI